MNKRWIVYLVSFAAFFGPFTQTIYTPMLPEVEQQLHTSGFMVNLTISIFTLVLALMQIVYGPMTDRRGRRKVLLTGILIYVVASIGAAFSSSIYLLLAFRALQAGGMAVGSVVAVSVIGDLYEGKLRGRAMGTFQMLVALGPVVGPVIGGFVGEHFGFHSVFWVLAVTALLLWLANFIYLPETKPDSDLRARFSMRQFSDVLSKRSGSAVILLGFIQYFTFYNFLVFLPDLLTSFYGLSASENGLVFLPMSLFVVIGSFTGGRVQEYFQGNKLLTVTASLNVFATFLFVLLAPVALPALIVSISLFGFCLGLSLPVQTTILAEEFHHNRATAIGVYNFFRYLGMAAGPLIGEFFYQFGNRIEFIFAGIVFAVAVWFAATQFSRLRKESGAAV
ncbi:MFS transporter [Pseudalkalibacillus caeni]|uniref:MFS transporter n=1 Tax=Exobacillus caeni TaxID=2574798 RepID=A0A5R9FBE2_9BACL|nr:MFS transporter [Pseudalkalibacillus caeni]TLS36945.1 MFS transporter [Pseudalkalibacillus caeni]